MAPAFDEFEDAPRKTRPWLWVLVAILVAFAGGAIAMGWMLTHWDTAARYLRPAAPSAPVARVVAPPAPQLRASGPLTGEPALDGRIATLEARLASIDRRAREASGNAGRAEGLLVAFAARRALDRGIDLGYIEALLRERFGGSQPQAVATVIAAARQPVTLPELRSGLEEIAPTLVSGSDDIGWWQAVRRELAGLIVLRRANTPSNDPDERLDRARRLLESGQVDGALAEVIRMPGSNAARAWIAQARRYVSARGALDRIETAALLDPRTSASAPPVQPPVDEPATEAPVIAPPPANATRR